MSCAGMRHRSRPRTNVRVGFPPALHRRGATTASARVSGLVRRGHRMNCSDFVDRARVSSGLVFTVSLHSSEAESQATGILLARLNAVELDFDDELGPH